MPASDVRLAAVIEPQDVGRVVRLDAFGCEARVVLTGRYYHAQTRPLLAGCECPANEHYRHPTCKGALEDWSTVQDPAPGFLDTLAEALDAILSPL